MKLIDHNASMIDVASFLLIEPPVLAILSIPILLAIMIFAIGGKQDGFGVMIAFCCALFIVIFIPVSIITLMFAASDTKDIAHYELDGVVVQMEQLSEQATKSQPDGTTQLTIMDQDGTEHTAHLPEGLNPDISTGNTINIKSETFLTDRDTPLEQIPSRLNGDPSDNPDLILFDTVEINGKIVTE